MKKIILPIVLLLSPFLFLGSQARAISANIVISEVAMGSSQSASDEFIELYNNSEKPLDIGNWRVEYKSATGKHWQVKADVAEGEKIGGHEFYIFRTSDKSLTSGLAQAGGNLRLIDGAGQVVDTLAWGNGDTAETAPALTCIASQSLGRAFDVDGQNFLDSDNNQFDFSANVQSPTQVTTAENVDDTSIVQVPDVEQVYAPLEISELLPDPVAPLADSSDEFIEIFNPTTQAVTLTGWSLVDAGGHTFKFGNEWIGANSYLAIYSKLSKISLNNSGDTVELINPAGEIVSTSPNYGASKSGLSWGETEDGWGWTARPTANAINATLVNEQAEGSSATTKSKKEKAVKLAVAKKTTSKAKTTPKAKATKAKTKSKLGASKIPTQVAQVASTTVSKNNFWTWLLIVLGVGTMGYGIYEYRPEISAFFRKLKSKFDHR